MDAEARIAATFPVLCRVRRKRWRMATAMLPLRMDGTRWTIAELMAMPVQTAIVWLRATAPVPIREWILGKGTGHREQVTGDQLEMRMDVGAGIGTNFPLPYRVRRRPWPMATATLQRHTDLKGTIGEPMLIPVRTTIACPRANRPVPVRRYHLR